MPPVESALILGGLGQIGRLMAGTLAGAGVEVSCADLRRLGDQGVACGPGGPPYCTDVTRPNKVLLEKIAASDCIVVCLPEAAALAAAPLVLDSMAGGALWVDTLSVKSAICRVLRDCGRGVEMLSINPMFAPALGWSGRPVAVVEVCGGVTSGAFLEMLRSAGAEIEMVTAEAHDSITAAIQVATHAAILSFGLVLADMGYRVEEALAMATPPHRLLLALLSRVVSGNPEVYWDIQHHHPEGERVRSRLAHAVAALDRASGGSPDQFASLFERMRDMLGAKAEILEALSERIIHQTPGTSK